MLYFKVLKGNQAGFNVSLDNGKLYNISNQFTGDIFIDFNLDGELSCDIEVKDNTIRISSSNKEFTLLNGGMVDKEINYETPLIITCGEVTFEISDNPAIDLSVLDINNELHNSKVQDSKIQEQSAPSIVNATATNILEQTDSNQYITNKSELINNDIDILKNIDTMDFGVLVDSHNTIVTNKRLSVWFKLKNKFYSARVNRLVYVVQSFKQKKPFIFFVSLGSICLIIMISTFIGYQILSEPSVANVYNDISEKRKIQKHLLSLPSKFNNLKLIVKDNKYTITGIVGNVSDIESINKAFSNYGTKITLNIKSFSQIKPVIQEILLGHKLNLIINYSDINYTVILKGIINNYKSLDEAVIDINNKLPMLFNLDISQVFVQNEIQEELDNMLKTGGYKNSITVNANYMAKTIDFDGFMANNKIPLFKQLVFSALNKYLGVLQINFNVKDIKQALPFSVVEIYTGSPSYITTNEGEIIYPGGSSHNIVLVSISDKQLVFQSKYKLVINLEDLFSSMNNVYETPNLSRKNVIKNEMLKESSLIEQNINDISLLKEIKKEVKDAKMLSVLDRHIQNIEYDTNIRKKELNYYDGDKK